MVLDKAVIRQPLDRALAVCFHHSFHKLDYAAASIGLELFPQPLVRVKALGSVLTGVTIGAMGDLGLKVDMSKAERVPGIM